ncbi:CidA/LrgA family protein [Erysipelothrix sp. D19-032]
MLFAALQFKLIKVSSVEMVGTWLKDNLAFFFVPVTVGIMIYFDVLQATWVEFVIILIISTLVTYVVSAYAATGVQGDK